MVAVSFATTLRGSAGRAASLASADFAPSVTPSEARNLLFAPSAFAPTQTAPIPPAACRMNSLRFMTPPLCFSGPSHYRVWTPHLASRLSPRVCEKRRSPLAYTQRDLRRPRRATAVAQTYVAQPRDALQVI